VEEGDTIPTMLHSATASSFKMEKDVVVVVVFVFVAVVTLS
jgi:hypothetical protein